MAVNDRLVLGAAAGGGIVPSENFGVVIYEGDGTSSHSISGGKYGAAGWFNGSSSYISTGINLNSLPAYSYSFWFLHNFFFLELGLGLDSETIIAKASTGLRIGGLTLEGAILGTERAPYPLVGFKYTF